jgi:hypothetical protein
MDEFTDDQFIALVNEAKSWADVKNSCHVKVITKTIKERLDRLQIDVSHLNEYFNGQHTKFNTFTGNQLQTIVNDNNNWSIIMKLLGYSSCTYVDKVKDKLNDYNIKFDHINDNTISERIHKYKLDDIMVENSHYTCMRTLAQRLKKEKGWIHKCSVCNLTSWNDKHIPLEIDHINGVHSDNRIKNLRFICCNCHAQTDTYKGKNMKKCKNNALLKDKKVTLPKEPIQKAKPEHCCKDCNKVISVKHIRCNACNIKERVKEGTARKVINRPSLDEIEALQKTMSMVQIGKKYGVSDNCVRKWINIYKKYQ